MRKKYIILTIICVLLILWFGLRWQSSANKNSPKKEAPKVSVPLYFPMTGYKERTTVRPFGTLVDPDDHHSLPCGDQFEGFHTADDLEVIDEEIDREVPVFAITTGKVVQIGEVEGYGGLVVIDHEVEGKNVAVYYGHIDLSSVKVLENGPVKAGEKIANLGDHCSVESSFERKHLHFGIHKDPDIDVRGYVPTLEELNNWYDPEKLFRSNNVKEPTE